MKENSLLTLLKIFALSIFVLSEISFASNARFPSSRSIISKIAVGSCLKQHNSLEIFDAIKSKHPDLFVFGGDNIYGDTTDETLLKAEYDVLKKSKKYEMFKSVVPVVGTWDDHDYGINDGGSEHPSKRMSQRLFLDFFDEPKNSDRRITDGIYTSYQFGPASKRINLIILDTRFFRSKLNRVLGKDGKKYYQVNDNDESTILGEQQWSWLGDQLNKKAKLTIIVSSIQIISNKHRFEKWGNFPRERQRLFELIKESKTENILFFSGDRHFSELSKAEIYPGKKAYEITSSGMNHGGNFGKNENNPHRIKWLGENGFALLDINWQNDGPQLNVYYYGKNGKLLSSHKLTE